MNRQCLAVFGPLLLIAVVTHLPAENPPPPKPAWLWSGTTATAGQVIYLRKQFTADVGTGTTARLTATADNEMEVFLNGQLVLKGDDWTRPRHADVFAKLIKGMNTLAVRVRNEHGDRAGFIARLDVETYSKPPVVTVSDDTWKVAADAPDGWNRSGYNDASWKPATVVGRAGDEPWSEITAETLFRTARRPAVSSTPAEQITVKSGFRVELLYTVPRDEQGSWISLCTDPKGRLYTSDQYGGLYRVTPPPLGQAEPIKVEPVPVACGEAHGLAWAFDSLYVVVNKGQKYESGLYRLRDLDGDDTLDSVQKLRDIAGDGEHGPHAVVPGPDGQSLYVIIGNHTPLGTVSASRVPRVWREDLIVQRLWDAKGHAHDIYAPGGYVIKTDRDGKAWELFSVGYRNAYDAAFNRHGELFTFDSDMEWDMNTPWYRPTQVCHVTSGSEFGWRSGSGRWPVYYPDSLPPVVEIGPGSPTGTCFGYSARFPDRYRDALYLCDWSYGKLYALHLTPKDSTYAGEAEEFLSAAPLPLTDVAVNPADGALYFTTGGRKTTSGLYRVTYAGDLSNSRPGHEPYSPRLIRHGLEGIHGQSRSSAVDAAWEQLDNDDRFIRFAARTAVECQDPSGWQARALAERRPAAALTALLALARCGDAAVQPDLLAALDRINWRGLSEAQRLELIRVYQLCFLRMGPPTGDSLARYQQHFDALFPSLSRALNSELCKLLAYLQAPSVVPKALRLIADAPTQEEQLDYATSLRHVRAGWTPKMRQTYFTWFRTAAGYRGGQSFAGFLRLIRQDAVGELGDDQKSLLGEVLTIPTVAAVAPPKSRPFVKKWTTDELVRLVDGGLTGRDFDRGRTLFAETRCVACHRFAGDGGANGPDLTAAAGRFNVRDLAEAIIEPDKVISDQYAAVTVTTASGKLITGRIVNLAGDTLVLNSDMLDPNATVNVRRDDVESMAKSKVSMMPAGLLDTCDTEEAKDLIAYVLSKGERSGPMFRR